MHDRKGNKLTLGQYLKRWKDGIESITPIQRIKNEMISSIITLIGVVSSIIIMFIFRQKLIVEWFAYALIIIFLGTMYSHIIKILSYRQALKSFKRMDVQSVNITDLISKLDNQVPEAEHETQKTTDIKTTDEKK